MTGNREGFGGNNVEQDMQQRQSQMDKDRGREAVLSHYRDMVAQVSAQINAAEAAGEPTDELKKQLAGWQSQLDNPNISYNN